MSSLAKLALMLSTVLLVAACGSPHRYPVSGEDCGPDDPVRTIDSNITDCAPSI